MPVSPMPMAMCRVSGYLKRTRAPIAVSATTNSATCWDVDGSLTVYAPTFLLI